MGEYSSFFNSVVDGAGIYDREYSAEDFAEYFASFVGNGVYAGSASQLQVLAVGDNMSVSVQTGSAWINGYYYRNATSKDLTLSIADGGLDRIDLIVVRLDLVNRQITAEIHEGTPSTTGVVPDLTRNTDVYEICLAQIRVPANANSITQANIVDTRSNASLCGWVSGVIDQIDTTNLFAQYDYAFNNWFNNTREILDSDVAGHLQSEIEEVGTWKVLDITLASGSWTNKQYIISNSLLSADKVKFLSIPASITNAQKDALVSANVVCIEEAEGALTLQATKEAPSINVPIQIIIGNGQIGE